MAWASNSGNHVDTFEAKLMNNALVMNGLYNGIDTRISFYDITKNHFLWKMERVNPKTSKWREIYRIDATRL
jgi:hypothetical protein